MKVAVASTDGKNVNEHFGRAEKFLFYEKTDEGVSLIGEGKVTPLSVNDPDHPFDPDRFNQLAEALIGCKEVYVSKIGTRPSEELARLGIKAVTYKGPIEGI
jgi:predicted Fe-Mo cluster-binding NifX family protein